MRFLVRVARHISEQLPLYKYRAIIQIHDSALSRRRGVAHSSEAAPLVINFVQWTVPPFPDCPVTRPSCRLIRVRSPVRISLDVLSRFPPRVMSRLAVRQLSKCFGKMVLTCFSDRTFLSGHRVFSSPSGSMSLYRVCGTVCYLFLL